MVLSFVMAEEPYLPIDCSLHDRFESAAVRRERVRVTWTTSSGDESGGPMESVGMIRDVVARDGAEYLVMSNGSEIRLDRIVSFAIDSEVD